MGQQLWEKVWQFLKMLNINLLCKPAIFPPRNLPKRNENICSRKDISMNIHTNIIRHSKGETMEVPVRQLVNK